MQSTLKLVQLDTVYTVPLPASESSDTRRLRFEGDPAGFAAKAPIRYIVFGALTTDKLHRVEIRKAAETIYALDTLGDGGWRSITAGDMLFAMSVYAAVPRLHVDISDEAVLLREVVVLVDLMDPTPMEIERLVVMATDA